MKEHNLTYEICVIGGGPGGLPAALAAARQGRKVLLIEKNGYLGGNLVMGLPWLGFLDRSGRRVIGGIAQEFIDRLAKRNATYGHSTCGLHGSVTLIHPEEFKALAFEMCEEAGVDILLHLEACGTDVENGHLKSVEFYGKGNHVTVQADVFIDATGDGDVSYLSGCRYEMGQDDTGILQPPTVMFAVNDVNFERFFSFLDENPDMVGFKGSASVDMEESYNPAHFRETKNHVFLGLRPLFLDLLAKGDCAVDRDTFIYINSLNEGQVYVNTTRLLKTDATDIFSLTNAEIVGHMQIPKLTDMLRRYVPGFENIKLSHIFPSLGVRETRRFKGIGRLTEQNIVQYEIPDDSIGLGTYMIDIHSGVDDSTICKILRQSYGVPYGCTVSAEIDNLMFSGRCISMDAVALSSARVMSTCMAIGQGAGIGAALAVKQGVYPKDVDPRKIREILLVSDVILK